MDGLHLTIFLQDTISSPIMTKLDYRAIDIHECLFEFYSILNLVGYLMPNPVYTYISNI